MSEHVFTADPDIGDFDCSVPPEFLRELERSVPLRQLATPWPIARECSSRFTAVHHSGTRNPKLIDYIVIHCTESNTAEAAARWFANSASSGSAHVCTDPDRCYRTLLPRYIPWAAPGANTRGWHLEIAGFARWTRTQWLQQPRKRGLDRAAYKAALHANTYNVPTRLLTVAQLKAGRSRGFTTHARCSQAFGGSHWDPGMGFPLDWFMNRVRYHAAALL